MHLRQRSAPRLGQGRQLTKEVGDDDRHQKGTGRVLMSTELRGVRAVQNVSRSRTN